MLWTGEYISDFLKYVHLLKRQITFFRYKKASGTTYMNLWSAFAKDFGLWCFSNFQLDGNEVRHGGTGGSALEVGFRKGLEGLLDILVKPMDHQRLWCSMPFFCACFLLSLLIWSSEITLFSLPLPLPLPLSLSLPLSPLSSILKCISVGSLWLGGHFVACAVSFFFQNVMEH